LGLSGVAGWGKTDLGLGLARLEHHHSIIFRRIFKSHRGLIERSREIYNPTQDSALIDKYNEGLHRWKFPTPKGQQIEFEAVQHEKDKFTFKGWPHDFYLFDEAPEFTQTQVEFILGWMRSTRPGQRCRAILTFNPPENDEGKWVIDFFLPWIAYLFPTNFSHPNPAKPGELRWYTTLDNGDRIESESGEPFEQDGKTYTPISRSFYFGTLEDNPHLRDTGYTAFLASMPEPERSRLLYGDFAANTKSNPKQIIPTEWVKLAQARWLETERPHMPLSGVGVDAVYGGRDDFTIAKRYGSYFDEVLKMPGVDLQNGAESAKVVYDHLENDKHIGYINVDVDGVGTTTHDSLEGFFGTTVKGVNGAGKSTWVYCVNNDPKKPLYRMLNTRAEMHWRMRAALDPEHGEDLALPPGNEVVADLCTARYKKIRSDPTEKTLGIMQVEDKEEIKKRIGRSPGVGDAIMYAKLPAQDKKRRKKLRAV